MSPTKAEILAAVNASPEGVTSAQLAARLGGTTYNVSGTLSKLAAYGMIDAEVRGPKGTGKVYNIWKPRAAKAAVAALAAVFLVFGHHSAQARTRHHRHHHAHHHVRTYRNFAQGLGGGLAHMMGSIRTVETDAGPIRVAAQYADRFRGFINALVAQGYKPHEIGCYSARGHMPNSKHHWGGACDIDQRSRNVTAKTMYHVTELAHRFDLTDGCEWRHPDCGHVEVPGPLHIAHHRRLHYAKAG